MLLKASADAMAALSSHKVLCLLFDYSSESMTGPTGRTETLETVQSHLIWRHMLRVQVSISELGVGDSPSVDCDFAESLSKS
jgi:hypothetical protein